MMPEYVFFGTDVEVRYAFRMVYLSDLLDSACDRHHLVDISHKKLFSEGLICSLLLSTLLQEEDKVLLKFQKEKDFLLSYEATSQGSVRGYLTLPDPNKSMSLESNSKIICFSNRVSSKTAHNFEGITESTGAFLHGALTDHILQSFQFKSKLLSDAWMDEKTGKMTGFGVVFLELPNLDISCSDELWEHVSQLPTMESLFEGQKGDPDAMASRLIPHAVHPVNSIKPQWTCHCSKEQCVSILSRLPVAEIQSLIGEDKPIDMRCHYCNISYTLHMSEVSQALALALSKVSDSGVN